MRKHPFIYSILVIFVLWMVMYILVAKSFFPSPIETLLFFFTHLPLLIPHLWISFLRIFIAIAITIVLGSVVGVWVARSAMADSFISPILYILYPIPKIAFLPLLMLFLGIGDVSKITLVALILFFQIAIGVRDSVKRVHPAYFLSIKSLGASPSQIYRHVIVPAVLPDLFTSLRISVGTSISVLFFAENFATRFGIGYFIVDSWLKLDYVAMFAGIVAIALMGLALFGFLDFLEKKICKWHQPGRIFS